MSRPQAVKKRPPVSTTAPAPVDAAENATETISFRVTKTVHYKFLTQCQAGRRTPSAQARIVIEDWLASK